MADVHDKKTRSYNTCPDEYRDGQIRSTNTKPELLVRKFLHAQGYRYRLYGLHPSPSHGEGKGVRLPGHPDIVLPKYKTIIFIHGCFWHGHANCKYYKVPQTRTEWWLAKINRNKANDAKAAKALKKEGWNIITIWECSLKPAKADKTLTRLLTRLSA